MVSACTQVEFCELPDRGGLVGTNFCNGERGFGCTVTEVSAAKATVFYNFNGRAVHYSITRSYLPPRELAELQHLVAHRAADVCWPSA